MSELKRAIAVAEGSRLSAADYRDFLQVAHQLIAGCGRYLAPGEDVNCLELAHLIPAVDETVLAAYVGINHAVCSKGLVTPLLPRHGHNNVFVFDPQVYGGGKDVPAGTIDAGSVLRGFQPPNATWSRDWTYVMVEDSTRTFESLWAEPGYIDMIPAKFEDFTMMTDSARSWLCVFISAKALEHPVNRAREYLEDARRKGDATAAEFRIPEPVEGEFDGLVPLILEKGQKLYVATTDFGPCAHGWTNLHPENETWAVVNETSAIPLDLVTRKPPVADRFRAELVPPGGSCDLTTDWFFRAEMVVRTPILPGLFKG